MKWAGFIVIVAAIIPLSTWLRQNPRETPKFWMLMGFLPFVLLSFHLLMAIISWPMWPGYAKGVEFSLLDALALALYLSLPRARHPLPFRFSMLLYFLAVVLSALHAKVPVPVLFYAWQLARMFLVYAVVTRACADPRVAPALLKGMAAALLMEAALAILQRFALGELHADGTLSHQNLLGLMSHLVVIPFFALLLVTQREWLPAAVVVAGVIVEVLTTSRATLGLAGFGLASVFTLSALRRWTSRKASVLLVGVATILLVAPLAVSSFERRFSLEGTLSSSDYDERAAFERAASLMLSDYPFGVGANNYVVVANTEGYNNRAGVVTVVGSESAHVHNIYWLVAAETGYPGFIALILLLLGPVTVALRCGWRNRKDPRGELLLGLGIALLVVYIHSLFEWVLITFEPQYLMAMNMGMVAGLAEQLGYWRRPLPRGVHLKAGALPNRQSVDGFIAESSAIVGPASDRSNGVARR